MFGLNRQNYLRKNKIFKEFGNHVLYQPWKLPNEPQLIKLHNNIRIAAGVTFWTHDVINQIFEHIDDIKYCSHGYCIEVFDNVFIGGGAQIVGNISIGPNAIIAAGSVVTKDVKPGTIVGGNPAKVIGSFDDLHKRRKMSDGNRPFTDLNSEEKSNELWKLFENRFL